MGSSQINPLALYSGAGCRVSQGSGASVRCVTRLCHNKPRARGSRVADSHHNGNIACETRIASLGEIRRFKETITILLVSGVFILLTASLTIKDIQSLDWRTVLFVASLFFVNRPAAIFAATIGSGATWQERLLTGWIAPRGIVAVAVSGLFGATLLDIGVADGTKMVRLHLLLLLQRSSCMDFHLHLWRNCWTSNRLKNQVS